MPSISAIACCFSACSLASAGSARGAGARFCGAAEGIAARTSRSVRVARRVGTCIGRSSVAAGARHSLPQPACAAGHRPARRARCDRLAGMRDFDPPPWLRGGHRMTIYAWARRRAFPQLPPPTPRLFDVGPDTRVLAHCHWQPDPAARPTLVALHGLEGSSDAHYMRGIADKAFRRGFNVVRLNQRNCGGTEHLSPGLYHSGLTSDVQAVLEQLAADGLPSLVVSGYSLGGNLALKLAGELRRARRRRGFTPSARCRRRSNWARAWTCSNGRRTGCTSGTSCGACGAACAGRRACFPGATTSRGLWRVLERAGVRRPLHGPASRVRQRGGLLLPGRLDARRRSHPRARRSSSRPRTTRSSRCRRSAIPG